MRLSKIKLGSTYTQNNVFLAPLAGYTNSIFRQICFDLGAGLTFTEMVSAKGLCYESKATGELLQITPEYGGIKACQLFGCEPEFMRRAVNSEYIAPFELIDINMGCPVPKIYKNGEGSALLGNLLLAAEIIKAAKSSGKLVSVKFRIGIDDKNIVTEDFAKMCEDSGADMITVHGRTRDKFYSGEVNFAEIERAKRAVSIPVIANGGIFNAEDAERLLNNTGADGVMIARGAMYAPWIFADITGKSYDKRALVLNQLDRTQETFGERFSCVFMRKMVAFYVKGKKGCAEMRNRLFSANSCKEVEELVLQIDWD